MSFKTRLLGSLLGTACLMSGPAAHAQEAADTEGNDIVVTARQRSESLQQVPDSVTAFSAKAIEEAGIRSIDDVTALMPNISLVDSQDAGTVAISIRGIGQVRNGEAPVALVIDGVQMTSTDMIKQALFDVDQIEVLKGPQGALYGRNAIGGAINITTKRPTNELQGRVGIDYSNGDDRRLSGTLSGALVPDTLLFRVAADYRKFEGVLHNVTLNRKVDFVEDLNLRGRLIFTPAERLTIDLRGSYGDLKGGASWYIPLPDGQPNNTGVPIQNDFLGKSPRKTKDASLKVDYEFGPFTLSSVSAYNDTKIDLIEDLDWTPVSALGARQIRGYESFSQEFRLSSPSDQKLRWTAGAYLLDAKKSIDTIILLGDFVSTGLPPSAYATLPVAGADEDILTKAAYAQINYSATDALELTAALRYDNDEREQTNRLTPGPKRKASFDEWQPKFSVKYSFSPESMVYATAARGFRSGGFNPPTGVFPAIYRPEVADTLEIGAKNSLADRKLTLNAAAFYMRYKDQQVFILNVADQGIVNVAKTDIYGFELEAQARPARNVQLGASLGFIDTKVKDYNGTAQFRGNKVPLTYRWSYTLFGQYRLPLDDDRALVARVDYSGRSGNYWHIDNADKQKPVHLVNARLTFDAKRYSIALYATNLFKERYTEEFFAKEFSAGASDIRYPGQPRRYGVAATLNF